MSLFIDFKKKLRDYGLEWFGRYYGIYRGTVEDNDDPEGLNRLRINVKSIYGSESLNKWVEPKGIYAGNGRGLVALPDIGDKIWVSFEGGDIRFPIWEYGCLPQKIEGAGPKVVVLQTGAGHRLEIDDKGVMRLKVKGGKTIEVNIDGISLGSDSSSAEPALLGNATKAELIKERNRVDNIIDAITNGVPIAQDGGIGYQSSMVLLLNTVTSKADYSNVSSEIVTLD